jgi:hypothetical protein
MKKFSKLILESKKEELFKQHPLINPVDWDEVFQPLIEHIESNLQENAPPPGEGVFSNKTKLALIEFMDSVTSDYMEYYKEVIDDGSQESFFDGYNIDIKWEDLMDCTQPLMDRTDNVSDYPSWEGGYWYMGLSDLKFDDVDDLSEDIKDVCGKLKMYKINFTVKLATRGFFKKVGIDDRTNEEDMSNRIKNILSSNNENIFPYITIIIYNENTIQATSF